MKTIPYGKQNITQEDLEMVNNALVSDFLTQGPQIAEFERLFAEYVGAKYAVAVANGTDALHLCTLTLGVDQNSNVITTPITFAASANCVRYCGGNLTFADIDPATALLDIEKVRALLENSPKGTYSGIIPVDFAGFPVNLEEFRKLADEYGLWIIEDACHAPGGYFIDSTGQKQYCGNGQYADLAIFSFHPVKHIACGEGGMVTTNNKALYEKMLTYRTHGITKDPLQLHKNDGGWYYEMQVLGHNFRLTDFQSALGISQLKRANDGLTRRREIARTYDDAFKGTNVRTLALQQDQGHAYHLYVILVDDRKGLYDHLRQNNIFAQVHYIPIPSFPYYKSLGYKEEDYPMAGSYYEKCLSIPMYPTLTAEEQQYVIQCIKEFIQ